LTIVIPFNDIHKAPATRADSRAGRSLVINNALTVISATWWCNHTGRHRGPYEM